MKLCLMAGHTSETSMKKRALPLATLKASASLSQMAKGECTISTSPRVDGATAFYAANAIQLYSNAYEDDDEYDW